MPFVWGKTNNVAVAKSEAKLADPNESLKPLAGDEIAGLTCSAAYDPKSCKDPFIPQAQVEHAGADGRHLEMTATWPGKDGKFPGNIRAITDCGGNCGAQLVHSVGSGAAPGGALAGYVSVGSSSASHDQSIDDKGRLVSFARSQLNDVSIGKDDVRFSSLVTTAQAVGAGAADSKDGRADIRVNDFRILGYPVELTRAGLRLANGGPSEQEAYDGAKALLQRLKDEKGIVLEIPNFDAQLTKTPAHVAVDTMGLRVMFRQGVGPVNDALGYPMVLGHSTAVVAALDAPGRTMNVNENGGGVPTVENTPQAPPPSPGTTTSAAPPTSRNPQDTKGPSRTPGTDKPKPPTSGTAQPPTTVTPGGELPTPATQVTEPPVTDGAPLTDPNEVVLPSLDDVQDKLGLRGAQSVSRAFGAFLGLGLILPLARFVIRRLG